MLNFTAAVLAGFSQPITTSCFFSALCVTLVNLVLTSGVGVGMFCSSSLLRLGGSKSRLPYLLLSHLNAECLVPLCLAMRHGKVLLTDYNSNSNIALHPSHPTPLITTVTSSTGSGSGLTCSSPCQAVQARFGC